MLLPLRPHHRRPEVLFPRPWRVVLAEDDDAMRLLLVDAIRADGHEVKHVSDGDALMRLLTICRTSGAVPDMLVSDVRMPGQTGLSVVRALRGWGWTIPIILITAFGTETAKCEAEAVGATILFSKPFDLDDLRTAVVHFLPNRGWGGW